MTASFHACGRCHTHWTGYNTCHCAVCHLTFTGIGSFTRHRRGGECADPAEIGLIEHERTGHTAWGTTMDEATREHFRQIREITDD